MSPNLSAFLAVLRACEGTAGPYGYRTLFGGALFDGYADHPRIKVTASGYTSTAAGAYQILASSWDDYRAKTGAGPSFDPAAQDAYAVWAIGDKRKALADVEAGRFEEAIAKCNKEWASLPGSPYGQPTRDLAYCRRVYRDHGGREDNVGVHKPAVDPAAHRLNAEQKAVDLPGMLNDRKAMDPLTLVSMLSGVFAPLIRAKVEKALGADVGKPLADNLLALAQTATGKSDPLEAVAVARQSPEVVAKLQNAAEDWLSQVAPLMDKIDAYERGAWAASEDSMDRAAARGRAIEGKLWGNPQFIVASFILAMVAGVVFTVLFKDTFSSDMQSFVIGAIVGSSLTAVISYFFGTSRSSAAKDVVIGEMAARR